LTHQNGAISNIEGGWAYPPPMFRTALEIAGDKGLIEHPADSSTPLGIHLKQSEAGNSAEVGIPGSPLSEDPYTTQLKHFYDVLVGKQATSRVLATDGLAAVQIARAAIRSAQTGRSISIEEVVS
jgi:predicted dehydrogenase